MTQLHFRKTYKKGQPVCLQGEVADRLFILHTGSVGVYLNAELEQPTGAQAWRDGELLSRIADEGAFLGEGGLFLKRRSASLLALEDETEIEHVGIGSGGLRSVIEERPNLGLTLCRTLARRLRDVDERLRDIAGVSGAVEQARSHYAIEFARVMSEVGGRAHDEPEFQALYDRFEDHPLYQYGCALLRERDSTQAFFQDLSVRRRSGLIHLQAQRTLLREGDIGRDLYYLQEGMLRVYLGDLVIGEITPGEVVGELAVLLKQHPKRIATVVAEVDCTLHVVPGMDFEALAMKKPQILVTIANMLVRRLDMTNHFVCRTKKCTTEAFDLLAGGKHACAETLEAMARALSSFLGMEDHVARLQRLAKSAREARERLVEDYAARKTTG